MNVSAYCIRHPLPALMLFVLLTFAGLVSFSRMKVQQFPDLGLPTVTISANLSGASPAQLETDVVRKIENSLANLQGLKHIHSKMLEGNAIMTVEFRLEKNIQEAVEDVRSAVAKVRVDLPKDLPEPIVNKFDLSGSPILAYTVHSDKLDKEALSWLVDDALTRRLLQVPGVGALTRVGGVTRRILVEVDPLKLQALNLTVADISEQLRKLQLESTSGRTDLGQGEQTLHLFANSHTAQDLQTLSLTLLDGRSVRLTQIAHVVDGIAQPRSQAMLDGQEVVGFEITRNKGASEIEVGSGVQQALADLKAHYPSLTFTQAFNFVKPVQEEFNGSMALLYEGALLAVVVVWAFLKNARATLIVALALPLSVIPTFAGMYCFDFTINVITLLALSLVVGILVDDAIVEVENIVRHLHMGKSAYDASMQATDEIGLAVIATTFSLIAVFLPTAFMSGISGLFFKQFGWTAALAVFASLMVARMLTPMMSAYLLKRTGQQEDSKQSMVMRYYLHTVSWCLKHRWLTLSAAGAFFISTLMLVPHLPSEFIPADDNPQTQVFVELPPGSTLAQTSQIAEQARQLVASVPYVKTIYTTIGAGSAGSDPMAPSSGEFQVHKATLTITLANRKDRPIRKQAIENHIRHALENLAGVRTKVGLGASGEKYVLVLSGDDIAALNLAAQNVERELRTLSGVGNIISTAALVRPEIELIPNTDRAADLGVTNEVIAQTLRLATLGDYDWQLAKLNLEQRQIPIVAKLTDESRKDFDVLKRLTLPSNKGMVRLEQVIDMQLTSAPAQINRYDRARNINFEIELSGLPLGEVSKAVNALPSMQHLPEGVRQISVGDAEMMGELFSSFGLAMLTGTLCILVVLILLFKDFLQPFSILAALPLSFGGSFIALLLAHKGLSMPSIIGLIMLMGIAVKNSILLVEYAIVAWRGGLSRTAALIDACHKRARPVIMTTIAMGAGMLPIALGLGEADSSFRAPMSIAVIGGLITSTLLSLLVIPVVFTVLDDTGRYLKRLFIHPSKQNDFI